MEEQIKKHAGGRKPKPAEKKATNVPWSASPTFIRQVEAAAVRDEAASASEWVRMKLMPHLQRTS